MARTYMPENERRAEVAWRRGYGYSLREIAAALSIRYEIVNADLRAWAREHPGQALPGGPQARRDKRMAKAARLRAEGLTLRQIAAQLWCHHTTVRNDLRRWDRACTAMLKPAVEKRIPGAGIQQPDSTPDAAIIPLRRTS